MVSPWLVPKKVHVWLFKCGSLKFQPINTHQVRHTKMQGKNVHFYSDNSCTGYVPPSKAQKEGTIIKNGRNNSFSELLRNRPN
jgi:hypothetical protein